MFLYFSILFFVNFSVKKSPPKTTIFRGYLKGYFSSF